MRQPLGFGSKTDESMRFENGRLLVTIKLDLKNAFDSVPHTNLMESVGVWIPDRRLCKLIERIVRRSRWSNQSQKTNVGLPQGGPLSPILFNLYINHFFDRVISRQRPEVRFIRWADDILFVSKDKEQLESDRREATRILANAGLHVNIAKTYGTNGSADLRTGETIEFLGIRTGVGKDDLRLSLPDGCPATIILPGDDNYNSRFAWATVVALKQASFTILSSSETEASLLESNSPRDSWTCDGMAGRLRFASRVLFLPFLCSTCL